jgi:hypothetical protein
MRFVCLRAAGAALAGFALLLGGPASALTLFSEDFDGYTSFPNQNPSGDYVNLGLPKVSEGADETWYGVRFEQTGCSGPCIGDGTASGIDADLFIQQYGDSFDGQSGINNTPVGRFEDDAGLILQISTVGFLDAQLDFDWRTFDTGSGDLVKVGYYASASPISFTSYNGGGYLDARTGTYRWSNWTQLMSDGQQGTFEHETFALPDGVAYLYVAFWMDDGEQDFGKIDNVVVSAIPEPGTLALLAIALAGVGAARRRA